MNLRRILTVVRKDLRAGQRDSIITYILFSPLLMAFGFRLLLPFLEDPGLTVAVAAQLEPDVIAALEASAEVEVLPDAAAVLERVQRIDDVAGVVSGEDGVPEVLLEGNEAAWVQAAPGIVLDAAAVQVPLDVQWESLESGPSMLRGILASLMAFAVLLMGGVIVGLLVLEEKESKTLRVYATAPLQFGEYLAAKAGLAIALSLPLGVVATLILLGSVPIVPVAIASIAALPAALLLGFLIAAFAEDQVAAVAMLKSLLFFFTSLPVAGFFVSGPWLWLLAPFTNHHAIQALYQAVQPGASIPWVAMGASLVTGLPLVWWVARALRRKLGFSTV
ncbi:MAG: hypothetical protein KDA24_22460 [Deltaproteobacteria bacterium]|nr:hypothetical protein [Deltaproteobacteria bacterium]